MVKNSYWQETDQLATYKAWPRIWTQDYKETNLASDGVDAMNPGPPDYNTSTLSISAFLIFPKSWPDMIGLT